MFKILTQLKANGDVDVNFILKLPEEFHQRFDEFFKAYEICEMHPSYKRILKPKNERTCRFCGKSYPEVTFRKKAHIIPELFGRSNFLSDYECDTCNHFYSQYETDLSAFIGISRSLTKIVGKQGIPTFKSNKTDLEIRGASNSIKGPCIQISSSDFKEDIIFDQKKGTVTINAQKQTYIPLRVFKALIKLALTVLPEEVFFKYSKLLECLQETNELQNPLVKTPFCRLFINLNPGLPFPSPLLFICKKRHEKDLFLSHTMILYFGNYIYQIFLPFYEDDLWLYDGKTNITIMAAPPLVDDAFVKKFGFPRFHNEDLSSPEKQKMVPDSIVMTFDRFTTEFPDNNVKDETL